MHIRKNKKKYKDETRELRGVGDKRTREHPFLYKSVGSPHTVFKNMGIGGVL